MPEVQTQSRPYQYFIRAIFCSYVALMLYYTLLTVLIVREDVSMFAAEAIKQNALKVQECQHRYSDNFCATQYTPALVEQAALLAGYLAKVMHSFCQNMSFQTMIFCVVMCQSLTPLVQKWLAVGLIAAV
ncbi:hypothetical protein MD484_g8782, partial [Candolleomyces efflorescens]